MGLKSLHCLNNCHGLKAVAILLLVEVGFSPSVPTWTKASENTRHSFESCSWNS